MRIERVHDHDQELAAGGFKRVLLFGTLDLFWRAPDGRVLEESNALAELRKQDKEKREAQS